MMSPQPRLQNMEVHSPKRRRLSPRNSAGATGSTYSALRKQGLERHSPRTLDRKLPLLSKPANAKDVNSESLSITDTTTNHAPPESTAQGTGVSVLVERRKEELTRQDVVDTASSTHSTGRVGGGLAVSPTRPWSPAKLDPRPLPPPAPEGDDELTSIQLGLGRSARWQAMTGISISQPEPELPPSVPDVVASTPPKGIHSSPSRWINRKKYKKISPLKSKMSHPERSKEKSGLVFVHDTSFQDDYTKDNVSSFSLDARSNPARQIPAYDPHMEKRKERDSLRDEIAKLKRDLQIVRRENEHIRLMQSSGRIISSQDEDAVLDVIQRHLIDSEDAPPPPVSHQLMKAAMNPVGLGLLPFSRPTPLVAIPDDQDISKIISHHPVPMMAEEELPYLQLFSPFSVASTIAVLPQLPNQPLRQRRVMTFRSRDVSCLFTSKVEVVVDAMNLNILELKVLALEPAAKTELTPFLDKICNGDCNRSMQRNIGILSWAMGEWYRVSIRRARLWSHLDSELATKGGLDQFTSEMRRRKKRRRKDDEESDPDESHPQTVLVKPATLLHFMGQQFFDLAISPQEASDTEAQLRLEWKIEFDWVGEAQSRVAVYVGVPGKWQNADRRDVLGKLPRLFQDLVNGGEEPSVAVKTIAALVVGERGMNNAAAAAAADE